MTGLVMTLTVALAAGQVPAPQVAEREALRHFRNGMEALLAEQFDRAEADFRSAIRADPLFDAAYYGLGQVYMATTRYEAARDAYVRSREAFRDATAREALDSVAADRRLKDQIDALKDYVRTLARQVTAANGPVVQAAIDRQNDQIRQLEGRLSRNRAGAPPPVPAGLSMALGSAYFRLGQIADAEREYRAAIAVDPGFGEAHSNLAVVCLQTGRYVEADREVRAAERAGFRVHPQLKADIKRKIGGGGMRHQLQELGSVLP